MIELILIGQHQAIQQVRIDSNTHFFKISTFRKYPFFINIHIIPLPRDSRFATCRTVKVLGKRFNIREYGKSPQGELQQLGGSSFE